MSSDTLFTEFAPAERAPEEDLQRQVGYFFNNPLLDCFTSTVTDFLVVLNPQRQIVYVNEVFKNYLKLSTDKIIGTRIGDVFSCSYAKEAINGCGTSKFCRTCGAVKAALNSQKNGLKDTQECFIHQKTTDDSLNLRVKTTPIEINNEKFTIAAFSDISDEKRRRALERIFFHDILNTATGLTGIADIINMDKSPGLEKQKKRLSFITGRLVDEILAQRDLNAAENNELKITPVTIDTNEFLTEVVEVCQNFILPGDKCIKLSENIPQFRFISDRILLRRVLTNMIKNALEATENSKSITIGLKEKDGRILFYVHNETYIPKEVQLQIFQRSFSTKGPGRGLGTYSMKLLSERYLNGFISFTSSKENGTIFTGSFPLKLNQ